MCRDDSPGVRFTGFDPRDESVKFRRTAQGIAVFWSAWGTPQHQHVGQHEVDDPPVSLMDSDDDGAPAAAPQGDPQCTAGPSTDAHKHTSRSVRRVCASTSGGRGGTAGPSPKQQRRSMASAQCASQSSAAQSGVPRGLFTSELSCAPHPSLSHLPHACATGNRNK